MSSGSSSKQQQQSTTTNTVDPQEMAMLQGNYASAQQRAATLTPYTGQMVADFNPTQVQAQSALTGIATNPLFQANNAAAMAGVQGVLNSPLNSQVAAAPVTAGMLANTDLTPYLNPYTNDVINASIAQNERARQMAQTNDSQQATAANAFGGSRSGVMAALTNGQYDQNDQSNIANLNAMNFAQAQNAATGDLNRGLSANEFNSGQSLAAQQDSFSNALAAAGLTINAAGQLVALNNDALNTQTQQAGLLSAVGDAQQNQEQQQLSAAYQNYLQGQQMTVEQQQLLNSALGMIPTEQTVNSSGSSYGSSTKSPGLTDILSATGDLLRGVGSVVPH